MAKNWGADLFPADAVKQLSQQAVTAEVPPSQACTRITSLQRTLTHDTQEFLRSVSEEHNEVVVVDELQSAIDSIVGIGFEAAQARAALLACGKNTEEAINALLEGHVFVADDASASEKKGLLLGIECDSLA